jgi:hypothetical protein
MLDDFSVSVRGIAIFIAFIAVVIALTAIPARIPAAVEFILLAIITAIICIFAYKYIRIELYGDFLGNYERAWYFAYDRLYGLRYAALMPHIIRYPWFASYFIRLFGDGIGVFFGINLCVLLCVAALLYAMCLKHGRAPARIAVFALIFNPLVILYCLVPNSEILFGLCVLAAFYAYAALRETTFRRCVIKYIAVGALCAAANFFRPLGVVAIIAIVMDHMMRGSINSIHGGIKPGIFVLIMIVPFLGGMYFMNVQSKVITGYDAVKTPYGWNLFVGASENGVWNMNDSELLTQKMNDVSYSLDEIQKYFRDEGIGRYREMGLSATSLFARKLRLFDIGKHLMDLLRRQTPESTAIPPMHDGIFTLGYLAFYLAAFAGAVRGLIDLKADGRDVFLIATYLIGSLSLFVILEAAPRYIVSYMPFFCICIAMAAERIIKIVGGIIPGKVLSAP